jgi:hypothetical protein
MKTKWMQEENQEPSESEVRDEILRLLLLVGREASICPSEVARSLRPHWRQWMPLVREIAAELVRDEEIEVLQKGEVVDIETVRGPIRLRLRKKV